MDRRLVYSATEMQDMVRQIEDATDRGKSLEKACAERGIEEQTFYRWRAKFTPKGEPSRGPNLAAQRRAWEIPASSEPR